MPAQIIGDTSRLYTSFYNYADALADPDTVTVVIYSHEGQVELKTGAATRESTGVYYYDYIIPAGVPSPLVYEFGGMLDGKPTVNREYLEIAWVNEDE